MSTEVDRTEVERVLWLLRLEDRREVVRYCRQHVVCSDALLQVVVAGRHAGLHDYVYDCHFSVPDPANLEPPPAQVRDLVALSANGLVPLNRDVRKATRLLAAGFDRPNAFTAHLLYNRSRRHWHLFCFKGDDESGTTRLRYARNGFTPVPLHRLWRELCATHEIPKSVAVRYRRASETIHAEQVDTAPKPA